MGGEQMNVVQLRNEMSADADEDWATFETFWELYPRKVARLDARKMWQRLTPANCSAAITALSKWRDVWAQKELEFVPHASTWLYGERWDDELPAKSAPIAPTNMAHVAAKLPELIDRTAMPDSVRAALAKLRGK